MSDQTARLDELKEQIERASTLIGQLRETNYSLSTELVELKNRLAGGDGEDARAAAAAPEAAASGSGRDSESDSELNSELELLRSERETVRKKLKGLLSRIEKLES